MPGQWHAPLSLLTIDSDGVILGSRFDWARWMVPKWSAEYGEITFAEAVDIGPWKAVRIYKTNSRFGMLFAPLAQVDVPDILEKLRSSGVQVDPGARTLVLGGSG